MSWKLRPCPAGQTVQCKLNNNNNNNKIMYREKLFRLLILTTHFKVIEIGDVASISNNN